MFVKRDHDPVAAITVASAGYLGDVAPYIPIANELADRGHDVTFLAPVGFHPLLAGERFRVATYGLDLSPAGMRGDPRHRELMRHPYRKAMQLGRYLMDRGLRDDPVAVRSSVSAALDGADALVTHPAHATVTQPVAEARGVPVVLGHLFPMLLPSREVSPPLPDRSYRLGPLNRPLWHLAGTVADVTFRGGDVNRYRRDLGVPPVRHGTVRMTERVAATVMLLPPPYVGTIPSDWPDLTWAGFSRWAGPAGAALDPELEAYLADGDPPVLVTLGTSAALDAGEQFARIAQDLDARGIRSLLLVGGPENLGPVAGRAGVAEFAPITALLPRCRAAVVSGALGSVAATLHAGLPMVVHPQIVDQLWNGRRAERLGLGRRVRRTEKVAAAVEQVVTEPSFTTAARAMADELAAWDRGPQIAADVVESVL